MLLQTLEFHKTVCDSSFTMAASVQEKCENILKDMLDFYPWLPEQGKKACLDYSEQYWLGINKCRKASLSSIDYFEQLLTPLNKIENKATVKKTQKKQTVQSASQTEKKSPVAEKVLQ